LTVLLPKIGHTSLLRRRFETVTGVGRLYSMGGSREAVFSLQQEPFQSHELRVFDRLGTELACRLNDPLAARSAGFCQGTSHQA
jgi:hypothetical protein